MPSKIFEEILNNVPGEIKRSIGRSMKIAARIDEILNEKGLKQSDLAKMMHKSESEISKWLSGDHNFTIATIDRIEDILDAEIINIPLKPAGTKSKMPRQTAGKDLTRRIKN